MQIPRLVIQEGQETIMNWKEAQAIDRESIESTRKVKESIHIRINVPNMNRMEGAYKLSRTWDQVLPTCRAGVGGGTIQVIFCTVRSSPYHPAVT